jgi:HD-GYP domain-containing protein (c-di-GMP phosphodiesterase class II)
MEKLASQISAAVTLRGLYPANHPRLLLSVDQVLGCLGRALQTRGESVTYLLIGDDLVADDEVIRKTTLAVHEFLGLMRRRGIERLTFTAGLARDEAHQFIGALASGEGLQSSAHIVIGRARVVMDESIRESEPHRELSLNQLEVVRDAWARFRVERRLPIEQLEELVWSFIDSLGRSTRAMLPLANLKAHDEYTFVHSVNVSLLVLGQARSFGIWGPLLHAFGMAGLLHDIGKLTIPVTILNKAGTLDDDEWELMKRHAIEGAAYLTEIAGTQPLSIVVAFEHHLRHDGRPNYPVVEARRLPHLASRMTAIADTFDAVSTSRPHHQPLGRAAAFEILKKRSGTFFDPLLVENFIHLFRDRAA